MFNIRDFLRKATGQHGSVLLFKSIVQELFKKELNLDIPFEDIQNSGGILKIKKLSAGAKSAIFLKKAILLQKINETQTMQKISDIRG